MPVYTLTAAVEIELEIRKSRFIGIVMPVDNRDAALRQLEQLRTQHRAATHVCWALMAGGQSGMSDDGEPSGTAGRPMLEVLRHHDLESVLATVVRYFGGVKLGAGGLVRAYTDAVAQALLDADKLPLQRLRTLACAVPYAMEGQLRRDLAAAGATLIAVEHGSLVRFVFSAVDAEADALRLRIDDATQGRAGWLDVPGVADDT